jgi:cytochrome c biogenesis protein CcmG/thiol:disulfide interchange protein DsbE
VGGAKSHRPASDAYARTVSSRSVCVHLVAAALTALACADPAPPSYTRLEGRAPELPDARSGAILVVFWATWCPPCREELPSLRALARDLPSGISIVTLGEDAEEAPVRAFFEGAPPPELRYRHDVDGRVAATFGVDVLPATFLVVDGRLVAHFSGPRDWNARGMRRLLSRLASEPPPRGLNGGRRS